MMLEMDVGKQLRNNAPDDRTGSGVFRQEEGKCDRWNRISLLA